MGVFGALMLLLEGIGHLLPTPVPPIEFPIHAERGWSLPLNETFPFGSITATTNSLGLRSPEPATDPPLRMLSLGDSSVFGDGVQDEETFSAVLAERTGADVQNGGVPGYTCKQSTGRYDELVDVLRPDILLIYSAHNDARVIRTDEAWMGAVPHPIGLLRLASAGATWVRIKRRIPRMSVPEYRRCLTNLVETQAARGGKTLLLTPVSQADFITGEDIRDRALIGAYFRTLDDVAQQTDTRLLNLLDQRWTQGRTANALMLDSVHPNPRGHALLARWIHAGLLSGGLIKGKIPTDIPKPGTLNSPF